MGKVTVKVTKFNNVSTPEGCSKDICCGDNLEILGTYWKTPVLNIDGTLSKYDYTVPTLTDGTDKPQDDSYKVVDLVDACGNSAEVIIADNETSQIVKDACNVCCGDAPVQFETAVPAILVEQKPCEDANGDRKISVAVRAGAGLTLTASRNGTPFTVVGNPFANAGAIKTYMDASMTAFGTWSHDLVNNVITLTMNVGTTSAGFNIV